ncbi:hypothetical protein OOU_Y34scaffold00183g3 [Pyricularia oryzae Y34]|nr:hypothetical protein OOU_Y34scaffold00183g3 [Pyricularia oryzae Y34]
MSCVTEMSYPVCQYLDVFLLKFSLAMADPDLPQPRYHHVVFVQTNADDGSGVKFHVVGDITSLGGMTYESTEFGNPLDDPAFHGSDLLGFTIGDGFRRRWDEVLGGLPTPPKQKEYNVATGRTELVKTWNPLAFYAPGEERQPPWKCTEWTMDHAIPALWKNGLIVDATTKAVAGARGSS